MSSVKVAVRVRPFNQREIDLKCTNIVFMNGKKTSIHKVGNQSDDGETKEFTFDYSYWSFQAKDDKFASQELIFSDLGEGIVFDAIEGYNSCIFAYGQTGSGKTHTMMGDSLAEGLIPRICKRLFEKMEFLQNNNNTSVSYKTEISYLEIYNEQVRDLLCESQDVNGNLKPSLKVREHPKYGPYVEKLTKHLVYCYQDIYELMKQGNANRTTASTMMNDTSSRSHAIFTILFSKASFVENNPYETVSKINLVDLAGSERANSTKAEGRRLVEGSHINKSLVTLGNVISNLAEKAKKSKTTFIPYRDSTLTWLLKDSLGGNSKTVMVATISPANVNYSETLNTLRYANRAKNILNKPEINEDSNTKLIRELRTEIENLRRMISQNPNLSEQVQVNEAKMNELTKEWMCKWDEIKHILSEKDYIAIRKSGNSGVVLDSDRPHLIVCVDDDVLSTGVTLYQLNEGNTYIGTKFADKKQHIIINNGSDVENEHCYIHWDVESNVITIHPLNNSLCFVNKSQITSPTVLHQGSFLVLGENNMFRFSNPLEVKNLKEKSQDLSPNDMSILSQAHLTGSCSYDSMYNSITSLNTNKKTRASTIGLNCQESDSSEEKCEFSKNENFSSENEVAFQKLRNISEDLQFIKCFLLQLKVFIFEDDAVEKDFSEIIFNILVKLGKEKNISKQSILQILSLVNKSEHKTLKESNESLMFKVIEYLQDKVNSFKDNLKVNLKSDLFDNKFTLNSFMTSTENQFMPNDFIETMHNNLNNEDFHCIISSHLNHLSKDVELQLLILKDFITQGNMPVEYDFNNSRSSLYGSPNILDELIEAEVQRRMDIHLKTCSMNDLCLHSTPKNRQFNSTLGSSFNGHLFDNEELDQIIIFVPAFHLQIHPDEHYVYEVQISINGDKWTIYRRYRCFLQLHKYIKSHFGDKIDIPYFPPKRWINNKNVKAIEMRRRFLENYIQKALDSCKNLSDCSLNFRSQSLEHLNRLCLYNFHSFFRVNRLSDN